MPDTDVQVSESNAALVRLVVLHAALVAVPVLVLMLVLGWWIAALPVAVVVGLAATTLRLRGIDDRIARRLDARPVGSDEQPRLAGLAESVAMTVGVPVPRLFVIDHDSANAVSWGAGDGPLCLAVTTGLLEVADVIGMEAVVGHHLAGSRRRSVEVTTLAASLFGPLAKGPLTETVVRIVGADDDRSVVRADLDGIRATRYPPGMVAVLEAIRGRATALDSVPPALSGLCFAPPHPPGGPFDIHPSLDDRIDLLREI